MLIELEELELEELCELELGLDELCELEELKLEELTELEELDELLDSLLVLIELEE